MLREGTIKFLLRELATLRFEQTVAPKARRQPHRVIDRVDHSTLGSFHSVEAASRFRANWIDQFVELEYHALLARDDLPVTSDGFDLPVLSGELQTQPRQL